MSKKTMVGRFLRSTMLSGVAAAAAAPVALVATSAILSPAAAQDYTSGAIAGNVVDASGNPVGGATVTIRSLDQGFSRSDTTSSSGAFRFVGLPIGSYEITATSNGQTETIGSARVRASATSNFTLVLGAPATTGDEVVVTGTRQNLDFSNTTTGVNLDVENLVKEIPIGRDLTSLALLAPGTSQGDAAFGNLASIGGSSVAENAYYVNGLNITDFNNYLGASLVPFDFYKSLEVKTGGYSAEFGRATGGVVNAVTKQGSNDFFAAVHVNWEPDALRSDAPDTYLAANHLDERRRFDTIFEVGGPIIKDKLFVYGLVELNDDRTSNAGYSTGANLVDTAKSPFWGVKVDAYPIENHHLEFTYFDTERKVTRTQYDYDSDTDVIGSAVEGIGEFSLGGESFVAKYTGNFTEWLTLSAAYGKNNDSNEFIGVIGSYAESMVQDAIPAGLIPGSFPGNILSRQTTTSTDYPQITQREFIRADADIFFSLFGDHHVRMGWEQEDLFLSHIAVRNGPDVDDSLTGLPGQDGLAYIYRRCGSSGRCQGTPTLTANDYYVELNYFNSGGSFDSKNIAYYFQDEWNVTNKLTLNLGMRLDQFNNYTANGSQFADFNKLFAPRGGFSYDLMGNGTSKLYANFGVYFLPIAANTGFRQGAQEWYFREYWTFSGYDPTTFVPTLDQQLTDFPGGNVCPFGLTASSAGAGSASCNVTGDGSVQNPTSSIAQNLRATREREIIVGYEQQITDLWTLGINYTRRNLRVTAEDVAIDLAVINYCNDPANGVDQSTTACSSIWTGYHQYTIVNPGADATIVLRDPLPGETELRTVSFTADELGYPKAERLYQAVEFTFQRAFDGVWSLNGSYTWSKSEGNTEGYVQSDFGQDDAGITQDFDQPEFTDGAYGKLPNHRAHRIKLWGSYAVTENLILGSQVQIESPRKLSCFGYHPLDQFGLGDYVNFANGYGAASHYCGGVISPRGTAQETDWVYNVNASVRYNIEIPSGQLVTLRADVFNLFNFDAVQNRNETGDATEGGFDNPNYGLPTAYQEPRYVRLGADINF